MRTLKYILLIAMGLILSSCKEYLDVKPDEKLAVPSDNLKTLELLLDHVSVLNQGSPGAGDLASDDTYIPDAQWSNLLQAQRTSANAYIWEKDLFNDSDVNDWAASYRTVFYANLVLDGLEEQKQSAGFKQWKELRGAALFHRAYAYYNLLQTFANAYNPSTAKTDPGIVLKSSSNINEKISRSSVQESYDHLLTDLKEAKSLLPSSTTYKTQPSAIAAAGLLARVFLVMQQYDPALQYAEEVLSAKPALIDYNSLVASANFPLKRFNEEVIFHTSMITLTGATPAYSRVSAELYSLYQNNDLRKTVFYSSKEGNITFKGSYYGSSARFNGLASNELYLIAAECYVRKQNPSEALQKLNSLLEKRWKTGTFVPVAGSDDETVLRIILEERRKELAFRNIRWSDLKRLNREQRFQKTLSRQSNNQTFTLAPNDPRYAMPIPIKVISLSGIAQN